MPLRHGRNHQNQRIERIVTANVGLVWSVQHLEHNAQRQNAPAHSTPYFAITIAGKNIPWIYPSLNASKAPSRWQLHVKLRVGGLVPFGE